MLIVVHTQEGKKTELSQRRSSTAHALTRICKHTHTHAVLVDNKSKSNHQSHYHSIRNQLHTINIGGGGWVGGWGGRAPLKLKCVFTCRATVQHVEKKSIKTKLHQDTCIHITQL